MKESLFAWKYGEYVWFHSNFTDQYIKFYQWCMENSLRNHPKELLEILYWMQIAWKLGS